MTTVAILNTGRWVEIGRKSGKQVAFAQFFELDIDHGNFSSGSKMIFPYLSKYDNVKLNGDFDQIIEKFIKKGGFDNPKPVPRNPGNGTRKIGNLSICNELTEIGYIIIKLSDSLNWRFSTVFQPFTAHEDLNSRVSDIFSDATLVSYDGNAVTFIPPGPPVKEPYPASKWAFFLFDGTAAKADYAHHFNIHVELLDPAGGPAIGITIDPDVGHPGGGGTGKP
jgi:hypothetical protein